ncbi:AAA family ATPase [Methylobacterium sp. 10]|uniref:AAA family ATPase n=1 Tax=Methylobacterium sp. 10 TaxID=1101191 RepID=UPI000486B595|nr:AAA family ATPase [Methylobacterium sp. 10]
MRILAIRGENLASLAAPFSVDLSGGPIGATGIFAITGETGAGKSTILDALCLALYGRYPRVATSGRERAPDPGGDPITIGDERAILRRGATEGFAEVDFIGRDGQGYCARWSVYRARGKANGRLQNKTRSLTRLADGGSVGDSKAGLVDAAICDLTDLTFDQFRRTVLLAQGEFDAFLLAAEGERADLLEKITGTAIYSEISKRIHAGAEAQRAAVKELEAHRDAVGLLDEAARAEKHAERARLQAEVTELSGQLAELNAALAHARRITDTRGLVSAAESRLTVARQALETHRPDSLRLAELDAVEPLREPARNAARAERDLIAAEAALVLALAARGEAEARARAAREAHDDAARADEASEAGFKAFGPVWTRAAELDTRIAEAATESAHATEAATAAEAKAVAARTALEALDAGLAAAEAARAEVAARFAADTGGAFLAGRAEEAEQLFAKRATLSAELAEAKATLRTATDEAARRAAAIATGDRAIAQAKAARTQAAEHRASLAAALDQIGEGAARARLGTIDRLAEHLREALPLARGHGEASLTVERAVTEAEVARRDEEAAQLSGEEAAARQARAIEMRKAVAPLAELAEEAVSQQAAHLRSLLVEDQPCPVCGATDHPHARDQDGLGRVAEALKAQRAEQDAAIAAARETLAEAASTRAAAGARLRNAEQVAASAQATQGRAAAAYADLRPHLLATRGEAGVDGTIPERLDAEAAPALLALVDTLKRARAPLLPALERAGIVRGEIDALNARIEAGAGEIEAAELARAAEREALRLAELTANGETVRVSGLTERVVSLGREIAPYLAGAGLSLADLDRDGAGAAQRVAKVAAEHRALDRRRDELDREAQSLASRRAGAAEALGFTRAAADAAGHQALIRSDRLAGLRAERAPLLGGEETGAHRTRINASRKLARDALKQAEEARAAAQAALASAVTAAEHGAAARDAARRQREEADAAYLAACAPRGIAAVREALALPPEIRASLRQAVDGRTLEAREAETALATRRADLALLLDAPEIDAPATQAAASGLAETITAHQQGLGAITADLHRDDAARERAAGLEATIAEARADYAVWEAVNEAVGSASGVKFRLFAQGVTLEHLVRLANEHLLALSPRYRLVRGDPANLSLHVVDRDMGEEVRATRSLSGGERFLVSLALALALSGLEGRDSFVDTLFIDEGFGSLDAETLDLAVDALETLQGRGRKVGVITHVAAMIERIAVQVRVEKRGNGRSVVSVVEAGAG